MLTSRRRFFAAMAAAFVVDPERLLFVPGKRLISIPNEILPPCGVLTPLENAYKDHTEITIMKYRQLGMTTFMTEFFKHQREMDIRLQNELDLMACPDLDRRLRA